MDTPSDKLPLQPVKSFYHGDIENLAYVRPVKTDKGRGFAVCDASGNQLAIFSTRDEAYFEAKRHDLVPALLH